MTLNSSRDDPLAIARNMLYDRPELYEAVYHGTDHEVPRMAERLFLRHLGRPPATLLDIGCGTGRDLGYFSTRIPHCIGIDLQEQMIDFARTRRPGIDFRVDDMRTFDTGSRFEAITCLGLVFSYLVGNDDIDAAIATMARHAEPGAILVLELINAIAGVSGERMPQHFEIDVDGLAAHADAHYSIDRRTQILSRRRVWRIEGQKDREDSVRWRLVFPKEIELYLQQHGFRVLELHDNPGLSPSDLTGSSLFVIAAYGPAGQA